MQHVRAIAAGVGGDRRLWQHNHQAALKCPRCDSFNTKFCYYNNYNLSQPRHFCKSCRRYWTKGGVLRNVPIGGGCRKTKRSGQKSSAYAERSSSSESSSLAATAAVTKSAPSTSAMVCNFSDNGNPSYDYPANQSMESQIFPTEIGRFGNPTSYGLVQKENQASGPNNSSPSIVGTMALEELRLEEIRGEMRNDGMAMAEVDWGSAAGGDGGDQELFDLTAAVDPAYWSQPQWSDGADQSLNFLSE